VPVEQVGGAAMAEDQGGFGGIPIGGDVVGGECMAEGVLGPGVDAQ